MEQDSMQMGTIPDVTVDHEIHGVTPDMIDWWWVNMEKGYPLWEPNEHKSFVWEVPPGIGSYVGAVQTVEESVGGGPLRKIRIRWDDARTSPIPVLYEHAILCTGLGPKDEILGRLLHQYEATSYGTRMRSTMRFLRLVPPEAGEAWARHNQAEVSNLPGFLPQLYRMWQVIKDPAINRRCSLKVKRNPARD